MIKILSTQHASVEHYLTADSFLQPGSIKSEFVSAINELRSVEHIPIETRKFSAFESRVLAPADVDNAATDFVKSYLLGRRITKFEPFGSGHKKGTFAELQTSFPNTRIIPLIRLFELAGHSGDQVTALFLNKFRETLLETSESLVEMKATGLPKTAFSKFEIRAGMPVKSLRSSKTSLHFNEALYSGEWDGKGLWRDEQTDDFAGLVPEDDSFTAGLNYEKTDATSLNQVVEMLKTMLEVARESALDVVSLVEQYLDWVRHLRDRLLSGAYKQQRRKAIEALLKDVNKAELERTLSELTVAFATRTNDLAESEGTLVVPHFNNRGLDRTFQQVITKLLAPPDPMI